jgi:hypothetical protein
MATNFMPFLNENVELTPSGTSSNTSKQVLLFGQRITEGVLTPASNGNTQPNYYIPWVLPSFKTGNEALAYLNTYGIKSQIGYNFTLILPQPTAINSVLGNTVLTWSTVPYGFTQLTDFNLSGTLTQGILSGSATIATINNGVASLTIQNIVAFSTSGGNMTLTGVNNVQYPDPNETDPIALMVWDFYQTALSAASSANGVPNAILSITSDRETSITAVATPIVLGAPDEIDIETEETTVIYPENTVGLGYLPTTAYGNTIVSQNTASGIYGGYSIQNGNVVISITDVTGTFIVSDPISIVLDNTINAYTFLDGVDIHSSVLQFPINNATNISTTHADYYNGNTLINEPAEANNGHYFTYAIAGNITSLPNQVNNLPIANDQTKILVTYPYVQKFGNIPYDNTNSNVASGRIASCVAYMLANGDAPYPPLMLSRINHLPVSSVASTTSYSIAQNSTGNAAVTRGWLPLAPNSNNVVQFLQSNTTLTTLPGTNVPDIEFRYTHIWDCVRDLKRNIAQYFQIIRILPDNAGSALISPSFLTTFKNGIVSILYTAQTAGVVQNVALYADLVTVTQDPDNPNQVDAYVPSQIIPQLNGANILINVFSSLYQFNAA